MNKFWIKSLKAPVNSANLGKSKSPRIASIVFKKKKIKLKKLPTFLRNYKINKFRDQKHLLKKMSKKDLLNRSR